MRPILHLSFEQIITMSIYWLDERQQNRNFDLEIITKSGDKVQLSNIDRNEAGPIEKHFKDLGIVINHVIDQSEQEEDSDEQDEIVVKDKKSHADEDDVNESEDEDDDFDPNKPETEDEAEEFSESDEGSDEED